MKINLPVVAGVVLGAAHVVLAERRHRQSAHLTFVRLHTDLIRDTAADSRFSQLTNAGHFTELDADKRAQYMTANRWVSLWSAMRRMGFLTRTSMCVVADEFMESNVGREFWALARDHRRVTARDSHDERFNSLMDDAFESASAA